MICGIFGGSFDPPHCGHVGIIRTVLAEKKVEGVVVVPTVRHPFGKGVCSFEDRYAMCELMVSCIDAKGRVWVDDIEKRRNLSGKTLDTIEALIEENPEWCFRLIIGSDILFEKHMWFKFNEVVKLAPPVIVVRRGFAAEELVEKHWNADVVGHVSELSSTFVRQSLAAGEDCSKAVPPQVLDYIRRKGLYHHRQGGINGQCR